MRVAVLGAGGTIAPAIVRDLAESDEVSELVLLDLDAEKAHARWPTRTAAARRARRRSTRPRPRAEPGSLPGALAGCDVLVNSASYRINLDAMRACLEAGCHYIDLGGLYRVTGEPARALGRVRAGGPARDARDRLGARQDEPDGEGRAPTASAARLDEVARLAAGRDMDPPDGLLDPLRAADADRRADPAARSSCGAASRWRWSRMADGGAVDFGDPIGEGETIYTLHSELRTFGSSFGCREGELPALAVARAARAAARAHRRLATRRSTRARARGRPAVAGDRLGASHRGRAPATARSASGRSPGRIERLGDGRRDRLDRRAGRGGHTLAGTGIDRGPRGAAAGGLHRPGRDVRRARTARHRIRSGGEPGGTEHEGRRTRQRSRRTSTASR